MPPASLASLEAGRREGRLWVATDGNSAGKTGRTALLLNGHEGGARRWRDWMVSEGFEALALAESAQAATDWIANRHD